MKMICVVDENWSIGKEGKLLFHIPGDLKRFKDLTENNIVIMGRKTLESLPEGKALSNRINIVLTENEKYEKEDVIAVNSMEELDELLQCINLEREKEQFVIGGGEIVGQLIDKCTEAYITKVLREVEGVDTRIPNLDERSDWEIVEKSNEKAYEGLHYKYFKYRRK